MSIDLDKFDFNEAAILGFLNYVREQTGVTLGVEYKEFLEFVNVKGSPKKEWRRRCQAYLVSNGFSSVDEWVGCGTTLSLYGQGSTRQSALADLMAELRNKTLAHPTERGKGLIEIGDELHAA